MAEYIEREAAIQAASIWNGDESTEAWIKSTLKNLPAADVIERKREWIPVTERLPKFGVWALCKCRANIYEVLKWTADGWKHDPRHIYMSGFVTHWMPLPEPPKEGET